VDPVGGRPAEDSRRSDELLQEVVRIILDAYYELQFSDHSYWFRARSNGSS